MKALLCLLAAPLLWAQESLHYSINWPSGLSLGEATLTGTSTPGGGNFSLVLEAAVPGFPIRDEYASKTDAQFCSTQFTKSFVHGTRKAAETSEFDTARSVVVRRTEKGGKSEMPFAGPCPKDALAFLFFVREELKAGRLPGAQTIYFGAAYQLRLQYAGADSITLNGKREECDRLSASVKGPASELGFEILFGRDAARTPLAVRVPFAMGTFSMELIRE